MLAVFVNGEEVDSVTVSDRGLQYGDGVWKTLAILILNTQFLREYLKRLAKGFCSALSLQIPDSVLLEPEVQTIRNPQLLITNKL